MKKIQKTFANEIKEAMGRPWKNKHIFRCLVISEYDPEDVKKWIWYIDGVGNLIGNLSSGHHIYFSPPITIRQEKIFQDVEKANRIEAASRVYIEQALNSLCISRKACIFLSADKFSQLKEYFIDFKNSLDLQLQQYYELFKGLPEGALHEPPKPKLLFGVVQTKEGLADHGLKDLDVDYFDLVICDTIHAGYWVYEVGE
jgi:hypothetical protein